MLVVPDLGRASFFGLDMLSSFFSVEESCSFFERPVLGLDDEEVQEDEFKGEPATVDNLRIRVRCVRETDVNEATYVVFPLDGIKGDGVDVLIEDEGERNCEVEYCETFGSQCEWQDFDGI